jgi:hypothetical protein
LWSAIRLNILSWDSFVHLRHDDQRMMFQVFAAESAADSILIFNAGFSLEYNAAYGPQADISLLDRPLYN